MKSNRPTWEIAEKIKLDIEELKMESYRDGIRAAASFIGEFDKQIKHPFRMEDVVLFKFNLTGKKPRKKKN